MALRLAARLAAAVLTAALLAGGFAAWLRPQGMTGWLALLALCG